MKNRLFSGTPLQKNREKLSDAGAPGQLCCRTRSCNPVLHSHQRWVNKSESKESLGWKTPLDYIWLVEHPPESRVLDWVKCPGKTSLNYFQQRELLLWASLFNSLCSEQFLLVSETSFLWSSSRGTAPALGPVLCASLSSDQLPLCVEMMNCVSVSSCALLEQCLGAAELPSVAAGAHVRDCHPISTCS